jgi:hypothetical protein
MDADANSHGGAEVGAEPTIDADRVIPVVVGATLESERFDRPIAARLATTLNRALGDEEAPALVCTDLWYLNDDRLRARPTVSVGRPDRNALSAYLGDKTPSAFVIDDVLMVQADPEMSEAVVCCWGVDARATAWAVDAFVEKYLDAFIGAALR